MPLESKDIISCIETSNYRALLAQLMGVDDKNDYSLLKESDELTNLAFRFFLDALVKASANDEEKSDRAYHLFNTEGASSAEKTLQMLILFGAKLDKNINDKIDSFENQRRRFSCDLTNRFSHQITDLSYCFDIAINLLDTSADIRALMQKLKSAKVDKTLLDSNAQFVVGLCQDLDDMQHAAKSKKLYLLLVSYLNNKSRLVEQETWASTDVYLFPYLRECACNQYNRLKNNTRTKLEHDIIVGSVPLLAEKKPVIYLSLGCGGLLADFMIIGNMILLGHQVIKVYLVEPSNRPYAFKQFTFLQKVAGELGITLEIYQLSSIYKYRQQYPNQPIDIIASIDFENIFKQEVFLDVMEAHRLLSARGRFYFSFDEYSMVFDAKKLIAAEVLSGNRSPETEIAGNKQTLAQVVTSLPDSKDTIRYLSLSNQLAFDEWLLVFPGLMRSSAKNIVMTLRQPRKRNYFGNNTDNANSHFTCESLAYFFSLCVPGKIFSIHLIDDLAAYATLKDPQDIVTLFGEVSKDIVSLTDLLQKIQTLSPTTAVLYNIMLETKHNDSNFTAGKLIKNQSMLSQEYKEEGEKKQAAVAVSHSKQEAIQKALPEAFNVFYFHQASAMLRCENEAALKFMLFVTIQSLCHEKLSGSQMRPFREAKAYYDTEIASATTLLDVERVRDDIIKNLSQKADDLSTPSCWDFFSCCCGTSEREQEIYDAFKFANAGTAPVAMR